MKNARAVVLGLALRTALACSNSMEAPKVELETCRDAWVGLTPLQDMPGNAPHKVLWHDGLLYYVHNPIPVGLVSVPDTGGTPSDVSRDLGAPWFWIEDDSVLYPRWDRLYSVPLAGGASELVSSGGMFDPEDRTQDIVFYYQELDASHMYWLLHRFSGPEFTLWRMPRDGGPSEQLGALPDSLGHPQALVLTSSLLLVAGSNGNAYTLPPGGGDVRSLPTIASKRDHVIWSRFLGAADSGMVWAVGNQPRKEGGRISYDVVLQTPTGATKDLWPSMPSFFLPDHAWSDGEGGWVIAGLETLTDDRDHTSVWYVDGRAQAKRLACDLRSDPASGDATAAAITKDAAYLVVEYFRPDPSLADDDESSGSGWKLVEVRF